MISGGLGYGPASRIVDGCDDVQFPVVFLWQGTYDIEFPLFEEDGLVTRLTDFIGVG